jgi:hypothetical protein
MFHLREGGHVAAANYHIKKKYFSLIDISNFLELRAKAALQGSLGG